MTESGNGNGEWATVTPEVNSEAEFFEIVHDFGNPLELVREAVSNAVDYGASWIRIGFTVEEIAGNRRLVVALEDNGEGMTRERISRDFWGLGFSQGRERPDLVAEKGHGTKIFFRSELVTVRTRGSEGSFEAVCDRPLAELADGKLHSPRVRAIDDAGPDTGTCIRIVGYNDNEGSQFIQDVVKDYLLWFTKVGCVEREFGIEDNASFEVHLKCLDRDDYETVPFGHPFPEENSNIGKLYQEMETAAADWYVKRYKWPGQRLETHPEVTFDVVISVEGDEVKRAYNPLAGQRRRSETGRYRMSDRYGIWLCKDYIPVRRVNDWITGFGSGSNAFVLLHGFVNCQSLKLTANRGDIANTDPRILKGLREAVVKLIDVVDDESEEKGIYTLRGWQEEARTAQRAEQREKSEFKRRVKALKNRRVAELDGSVLSEPMNEAELFGLFMTVYAMQPSLFDFEPCDYNASRGIDMIARNKGETLSGDDEYWYVELKHTLRSRRFNHTFKWLRWIVCWDFDKSVVPGSDIEDISEGDTRVLQAETDSDGHHVYFLNSRTRPEKVQVIRLRELLGERMGLQFT